MPEYDPLDQDARAARAEERKFRDKEQKSQAQLDVAALMSEPWGRRIASRMLAEAGVFRMSFHEDNPHKTSFREGERNIGNWLLAQLIAETPEQYALMMKENHDGR